MTLAAPPPQANMGEPVPRLDARLKVTGEARYASDMPVSNPAYAFLVTSAIAKGRISALDLTEASAVPGVLDILTHENTGDLKDEAYSAGGGGCSTSMQRLGPEIGHEGQIVAMVVAETFEAAREAAYKVKINYLTAAASASFGSPGVTQEDATKASPRHREVPRVGDLAGALAAADVVIEGNYGTPAQHHNPLELFTTTCTWTGDELTVYEPSQFVHGLKNGVAHRLGIAPDKVRVVSAYVGGAFGSRGQMTPRTALVALAARRLNRPVKLVPTRDQGFTIATYRAETRHHIKLGARRDGRIVGYGHYGFEVSSRPDPYVVAGVEDSARLYAFGAVDTGVTIVHADRNTPGFMRSPPVVPYIYALESAMDELAVALAIDPIELRRINDTGKDPVTGKPWSSRSLMACYDAAAQAFGWSRRNPAPASMREGDWLIGWGCATAIYPAHVGAATARVRLLATGRVEVQTAAHEIGNGAYTVIAQMAAEQLGVPLSAVDVEVGDSRLPPAPVAGGSNTTASCCSAVMKACGEIREKLFRAAAGVAEGPLSGRPLAEFRLDNGRVIARSDGEELAVVMRRTGAAALEAYAEFVPPGVKPEAIQALYDGRATLTGGHSGHMMMYALGAELVEVRVHAVTREIRVPRMVGAFAAGHIMNPRTTRSQYLGGMIWGIGSALHEATELDRNRVRYVNDNLADYLIPVNADVADIEIILVPEEDRHVNPAGVKGVGELANVGTAAAVANAVHHATGRRLRQLPIRIEDLL